MSVILKLTRAGPLTSIQDLGRFGMLRHGISASGPMDRAAYVSAGQLAGGGQGGVEFTTAGVEITIAYGRCRVGFTGGNFVGRVNDQALAWPGAAELGTGDRLAITPGAWGNYGYLRFDGDIDAQSMMGSIATSSRAGLGGLAGRALQVGDVIELSGSGAEPIVPAARERADGPIRIIWGIHADFFSQELRLKFLDASFAVSSRLDRMGVRLDDNDKVFADASNLSLVSDAIVPGDIQILGDGTPIVLMRDHQPTGGYPRIASVITADLDRFAQLRPGSAVAFRPVTVEHAHALLRGSKT
ncbi:biotin-dependent carboxyltransferase family protein [Devosia psychrophila]|jgi:allophanate hydrolase|uniref:Allophanate hydrolase n=1 Tax=Devosia psychrophila TaxID=728005 RepID=A0A0F5Q1X2_9HYPH|nr:biotin-dependent carboxyltransferase family protein [Devosia psychrophila]KKC34875.1 hypothetical protein WH91_01255 [Devosia psychrophila]SFC11472.1 allophanate hydrolase [Devosia psychrophila]